MKFFLGVVLCAVLFACYSSAATISGLTNPGSLHRNKRSCANQRTCMNQVPMLVDLMENDRAGALYTLTYDSILDHVCSKESELDACLAGAQCPQFTQTYTAQAVQSSLRYICREGRSALTSEANCFSRDDFQTGVTACSAIMNLDVKIATLYIQIGVSEKSEFCAVFDNFLRCVHQKVTKVCTTTAADFTRTVYAYNIKGMAENLNCTIAFDGQN